jgi:hypothetical protein
MYPIGRLSTEHDRLSMSSDHYQAGKGATYGFSFVIANTKSVNYFAEAA